MGQGLGRLSNLVYLTDSAINFHALVCRRRSTVGEVKRQLQDKVDVPACQQRLLLSGKLLGDSKTLQESDVQTGSVVHLVLPVKGGLSSPSFKFTDVSNSNALERRDFSKSESTARCLHGLARFT